MSLHGLPQGVTSPPPPPAVEGAEEVKSNGRLGSTPGTVILVAIFLLAFIVYYFANWKLLSVVWRIG